MTNFTRIYTHPDCEFHEMPRHPESPKRLKSVMSRLKSSGILNETTLILADEISNKLLFDQINCYRANKLLSTKKFDHSHEQKSCSWIKKYKNAKTSCQIIILSSKNAIFLTILLPFNCVSLKRENV